MCNLIILLSQICFELPIRYIWQAEYLSNLEIILNFPMSI